MGASANFGWPSIARIAGAIGEAEGTACASAAWLPLAGRRIRGFLTRGVEFALARAISVPTGGGPTVLAVAGGSPSWRQPTWPRRSPKRNRPTARKPLSTHFLRLHAANPSA